MRKIKLKKSSQKNKNTKHNKTSKKNKMIGGGPIRQSQRGLPTITIRVVTLGNGSPANPTYNNQTLNKTDIEWVVANKIKPGYQIVCLPMPPNESHSIIVNVSELGVMIVDWGGEINRTMRQPKWKNYTTFIKCLENTYGKVRYYEIDEDIYGNACERYETNHGQGGCSQYVHNWIHKYIGKQGKNAILLKED